MEYGRKKRTILMSYDDDLLCEWSGSSCWCFLPLLLQKFCFSLWRKISSSFAASFDRHETRAKQIEKRSRPKQNTKKQLTTNNETK